MILVIDNYDSFVYNLVQYLGETGKRLLVYRNDRVSIEKIGKLKPERIIISPGPGRPEEAGICCDLIRDMAGRIPILGGCLGHQCMGVSFGARVVRAHKIMHGKTSLVYHKAKGIFGGVKNPFEATRYHSLIVEGRSLPSSLEVTAWTKDREIMGMRHRKYPVYGVQFHPESILTESGKRVLTNFIKDKLQ